MCWMLLSLIQYVNLGAKPPSEQASLSANLIMPSPASNPSVVPNGLQHEAPTPNSTQKGLPRVASADPTRLISHPSPPSASHSRSRRPQVHATQNFLSSFSSMTLSTVPLATTRCQPHTDYLLSFKRQFRSAPRSIRSRAPQAELIGCLWASADAHHCLCGSQLDSLNYALLTYTELRA